MQVRRLLFASLLFAGCCWLPSVWAPASGRAFAQEENKKATKANPDDTETAIAELKKALKATEKELDATKKALNELKTGTADVKATATKVATLEKELAAATKTSTGLKADLAKLTADVNAVKAVSGDGKATAEKLVALEKGAEDSKKAAEGLKKDAEDLKKTAEKGAADAGSAATVGKERGDTAWMLVSSAFVLLMVPGLALFYGGMVRRKNVLATMMHSMAALAVVGVFWVTIGYALAFGPSVFKISALGATDGGLIGWSWDLVFLKGIEPGAKLPGYDIPVYLHVMFQGMFAIITPALISGAVAERIRFWPFCLFMLLWVTFVYCPLAHMVWAWDWFDTALPAAKRGGQAIGLLGKMGALDFAGGTVVHIAAGVAGLACCLVLGKRAGYPKQIAHPNSMVLTLLGAGLLWFGWFGFNGGSSVNSTGLSVSAFAATQVAAAAAGFAWMLVEWVHKGKPTALGLASGIVAGLVAVTPASGYVYMWGAALIGVAAAVICYIAVALKNVLGYDDSLDAFGVHGVGGFVGAVLTGVFCSQLIQPGSADGLLAYPVHRARLEAVTKDEGKLIKDATAAKDAAEKAAKDKEEATAAEIKALTDAKDAAEKAFNDAPVGKRDDQAKALTEAKDKLKEKTDDLAKVQDEAGLKADALKKLEDDKALLQPIIDKQDLDGKSAMSQLIIQTKAAVVSAVFAFVLSLVLVVVTQAVTLGNFKTSERSEAEGLDRTEHGEVGFDFSGATESVTVASTEPRAASAPRGNGRFEVLVAGVDAKELMEVWSRLCQPTDGTPDKDFVAVYPHVTTIRGTTFRCRDGNPDAVAKRLASLFTRLTKKPVTATKA
ncbi:Ammonia channel precursor [Gemmata obscuriglobus]|uniref:Ammonium transporter n=1 Tax=Gemmata obscuriglobus TaxID=114 RepID=A0A2Z3GZ63_9BACT|nr:ammonium transporter [Gemmata obscuriglobus]AWM36767.1 ammonium transporter [Gemmata obscuriglobus]QEG30574.1 Ammonia channel precursor [Gemmata obscuriglobus]VTS09898.1 ammonium transporter : Ammonium transporter OS=Leptospira terpstrae serovar Hualin str. LT 11-33 = ATCC 700639 GN=amt_4 PE=4 SV=1: Ammonium_transp: Ammonium_transp [Gemmata obscuriglobus UQM 2246]